MSVSKSSRSEISIQIDNSTLEVINDYLVDEGQEQFCGILVLFRDRAIWIFNSPVHGYDIVFGFKGGAIGRNF